MPQKYGDLKRSDINGMPIFIAINEVYLKRSDIQVVNRDLEIDSQRKGRHGRLGVEGRPLGLLYEPKLLAASQDLLQSALRGFPEGITAPVGMLTVSPRSLAIKAIRGDLPTPSHSNGRRFISTFSKKSRNRLRKAIAELDFMPFLSQLDDGYLVLLITLTLPSNWEEYAPTPAAFWKLLALFRMRVGRALGEPALMITKREFQRRGAPHFHIFTALPPTLSIRGEGVSVIDWISRTWFEIVGSGNESHLLAGTGVDFYDANRSSDPLAFVGYFAGYTTGDGKSKQYQNEAPESWEGQSVGRFWSISGFKRITATIEIDLPQFYEIRRTLRRLDRSKNLVIDCRVPRVNRETGEVRYRKVRRRKVLRSLSFSGLRGATFFATDGPALARSLAKVSPTTVDESDGCRPAHVIKTKNGEIK